MVTLCTMTEQVNSATTVTLLSSSPTGRADVLAGMSQLPGGCGVAVRLLGTPSRTARAASVQSSARKYDREGTLEHSISSRSR